MQLAANDSQEPEFTQDKIDLLKRTIAKGATDDELSLFLATAKRTGLDPFCRQIFCVKRYSGGAEVMSVQISIDGFRVIADRTGHYVPSREPSYTFDQKNNLVSATAYIKKLVAGSWHEVSATAFYDEYVQTTGKGNEKRPNAMWAKMPRLMLAKTAEALVLRKAFPAQLSGIYSPDEMNTAPEDIAPPVVEDAPKPPLALVEKGTQTSEPQTAQPISMVKRVADLCEHLNQSKDSIIWNKDTLAEYCNHYFDGNPDFTPVKTFRELDKDAQELIVEDLTVRLEERLALSESDEVIEGEIMNTTQPQTKDATGNDDDEVVF